MVTQVSPSQLSINFDASLLELYATARECIQGEMRVKKMIHGHVAADMDYSPSDLTRKLAQNEGDSRRFTLDDAELYTEKTGDIDWILFLVGKHIGTQSMRSENATKELKALMPRLMALIETSESV